MTFIKISSAATARTHYCNLDSCPLVLFIQFVYFDCYLSPFLKIVIALATIKQYIHSAQHRLR